MGLLWHWMWNKNSCIQSEKICRRSQLKFKMYQPLSIPIHTLYAGRPPTGWLKNKNCENFEIFSLIEAASERAQLKKSLSIFSCLSTNNREPQLYICVFDSNSATSDSVERLLSIHEDHSQRELRPNSGKRVGSFDLSWKQKFIIKHMKTEEVFYTHNKKNSQLTCSSCVPAKKSKANYRGCIFASYQK